MTQPHRLLKLGSAFELMLDMSDLSEKERVEYAKPLKATAKEMTRHWLGDTSDSWHGPLSPGHQSAAAIILNPRLEDLLEDIPTNTVYIERYIPALFPAHLPRIYTTWADLVLNNKKFADRKASLMSADTWWKTKMAKVPLTQAVTLHLLSDWIDKAQLYSFLVHREDLAYNLIKAGFHTPSVNGATMVEEPDCFAPSSFQYFLLPALIRAGFITTDEVLSWADHAIGMDERSEDEVAWFTQLRDYIASNPPTVMENKVDRWWLEPRERLLWSFFNRTGVTESEITDPKVKALIPLAVLLDDGHELTARITHLIQHGDKKAIPGAIEALEELGLDEAAERVEKAYEHVEKNYDYTAPDPMPDHPKIAKKTKKLNKKWIPHQVQASELLTRKLAEYGWDLDK